MPVTAALVHYASKLFILKCIKCRPLLLKTSQFLLTLGYFELALGLGLCLLTTEVLILSKEF